MTPQETKVIEDLVEAAGRVQKLEKDLKQAKSDLRRTEAVASRHFPNLVITTRQSLDDGEG